MSSESALDAELRRRRDEQSAVERARQAHIAAFEAARLAEAQAWAAESGPVIRDFAAKARALPVPPVVLPLTETRRIFLGRQSRQGGFLGNQGPFEHLRYEFRQRPSEITAWRVHADLIVSTDGRVLVPSPRRRVGAQGEYACWPKARHQWHEYYSPGWQFATAPPTLLRFPSVVTAEGDGYFDLPLIEVLADWLEHGA